MPKKIKCPHCGEDLREVGFITEERAWTRYEWQWNGDCFSVWDSEAIDDINTMELKAYCGNCDGDITEFVRKNDLL